MEATKTRELSGEKAQRIVEAMRSSVARRGIAGSTFEHVAREAGVSRGLLHYYFGTKEALLVEVVRRDTEHRIARLDEPLGTASRSTSCSRSWSPTSRTRSRTSPASGFCSSTCSRPGRRNPEILREVGELFNRTRDHVADILRAKQAEGVISPRLDSTQWWRSSSRWQTGSRCRSSPIPDRDHTDVIDAGTQAARHLLAS